MSEAQKRKKSFADRVKAVKESAPLTEKIKPAAKEKQSIGQPKKEARLKQDKTIVIYVNEDQLKHIEKRSEAAGFKAKDRAKWLKSIAISDSVPREETEKLKLQAEKLKLQVKEKENQIKMLKDILTNKV